MAPEESNEEVIVAENLLVSSCASYMTIAVPAFMREKSNTLARSGIKRHSFTTTETATEFMKGADVLDFEEDSELLHL